MNPQYEGLLIAQWLVTNQLVLRIARTDGYIAARNLVDEAIIALERAWAETPGGQPVNDAARAHLEDVLARLQAAYGTPPPTDGQ